MKSKVVNKLKQDLNGLEKIRDFVYENEPCGYYCDEVVGHVDHKYTNWLNRIIYSYQQVIQAIEQEKELEVSEFELLEVME